MSAQDWIQLLLIGGLLGTVGQGIRVIVGLKKIYDQALQEGKPFSEHFDGASLLFSLLIGFVAGVLGTLSLPKVTAAQIQTEQLITLIGIGYAGCDFIEGFIKKSSIATVKSTAGGASSSNTQKADQPPVG
jgi:hypothetical protein